MWHRVRLPLWLQLSLIWMGVTLSSFLVLASLHAKTERGTQIWRIEVPYTYGSAISVVDTTGVCLYVFTGPGEYSGITAIAKSTLPQGVGCQ